MGFVFSVLYFVTYYLTPATVFGPLAAYRVEMLLAIVLVLLSVPKLTGSIVLKTPQSLALIGMTISVFLSVLISLRWAGGAVGAWFAFIPAIFAYYLVCLHCTTKKRIQIMVLFFLLVCLFVIVNGYLETMRGVTSSAANQKGISAGTYTLVQNGANGLMISRIRGLGEIHDPNDFGQLLVCVIPLLFIFWKPKKTFRNICFVLLPVSALLFGTYLTHSRGALLALMAILIVATRRRIGLVPALVLGGSVFAASMALHFTGGREISADAGSDRTVLWGAGMEILKAHPLFGVGIGAFADYCDGCGHTAHNSLVVCAAETGLFGLFFWSFFLFAEMRNVLVIASPKKVGEGRADSVRGRYFSASETQV